MTVLIREEQLIKKHIIEMKLKLTFLLLLDVVAIPCKDRNNDIKIKQSSSETLVPFPNSWIKYSHVHTKKVLRN